MKKIASNTYFIIISGIAFIAGLLFYCIYHDIIIIRFSFKKSSSVREIITNTNRKKHFKFIYWHNNKWQTDEKELLESNDIITTLNYIINSWISLMQAEQYIKKSVTLQSIMADKSGHELFLSFDNNFIDKKNSTFFKLLLIESLLKTIRANIQTVTSIRILVRHKPLLDPQLDFSRSWPITGFLPQ